MKRYIFLPLLVISVRLFASSSDTLVDATARFGRVCIQKDSTYVVDYNVQKIGSHKIRLQLYDGPGNTIISTPITKEGWNRLKIQVDNPCKNVYFQMEEDWVEPDGKTVWIAIRDEYDLCKKCNVQ